MNACTLGCTYYLVLSYEYSYSHSQDLCKARDIARVTVVETQQAGAAGARLCSKGQSPSTKREVLQLLSR
jgi:hypothetical protein